MRSVGPGLAALALAVMAVAAPVYAADLPVAPAYNRPTPVPPAIYNWTAFYVGGNVGAGLLSENASQAPGAFVLAPVGPLHPSVVGLVGGAQAGVDYQFSSVVVGAQASWSSSYINGQDTENTVGGGGQVRLTSEPTWFASVTGRVGYAANTLLFYVKGGGAWLHINHVEDNLLPGGVTSNSQSISDTRSGFVGGVGLEYAMTENLSALFEYDFYDFGTKTENFVTTPVSIRSDLHTLTVGLNYRFNWASGGQPYCPTC